MTYYRRTILTVLKVLTPYYKRFQKWISSFHPLERIFIYASAFYITSSIILITIILNYQLNGLIFVSDWLFYMTVPGLILGSILTVSKDDSHFFFLFFFVFV